MGNRICKRLSSTTDVTNTFYVRDASGNTVATYEQTSPNSLSLQEFSLYGSARLGVSNADLPIYPRVYDGEEIVEQTPVNLSIGFKRYELSNHLGNVLSTISDIKVPVDDGNNGTTDYFTASVISQQSYYPFGMLMPERKYSIMGGDYRYGFNGKENDNEVKGVGNSIDFGARMYDPRLGRWLSVDLKEKLYPSESGFIFSGNSPIILLDNDGNEKIKYIKIIAKDGKEVVIKQTNKEYVKEKVVSYSYIGHFDGKAHPVKEDYNVVEFVTVNLQTNTIETTGEIFTTPAPTFFSPTKDSEQSGGAALVSKEYNGAMARYNPKTTNDVESINIDEFIGNLRGGGNIEGPVGQFVDILKNGFDFGGNVGEIVNKVIDKSQDLKGFNKDSVSCAECSTKGENHGYGLVKNNKNGEPTNDTVYKEPKK